MIKVITNTLRGGKKNPDKATKTVILHKDAWREVWKNKILQMFLSFSHSGGRAIIFQNMKKWNAWLSVQLWPYQFQFLNNNAYAQAFQQESLRMKHALPNLVAISRLNRPRPLEPHRRFVRGLGQPPHLKCRADGEYMARECGGAAPSPCSREIGHK